MLGAFREFFMQLSGKGTVQNHFITMVRRPYQVLFVLFSFDGLCLGSVLLYAGDAVFAAGLGLVALGGCDDLAVTCLQVKLKAGCGLLYYKFSHGVPSFRVINKIIKKGSK